MGVDPRFHKEKAQRMIRASVVPESLIPEEQETLPAAASEEFKIKEPLKEPEEFDAHDTDF